MRSTVFLTVVAISRVLLGTQLFPPASAQPSVTDGVYQACNTATFTSNDTFAQNLDTVSDLLNYNSSRVLYSLVSSESGTSSNYVHAMYQCRGDIVLSDCSTCVANALPALRSGSLCGYLSRGVRVQYRGCFLRYESYSFFDDITFEVGSVPFYAPCGSANESSQLYQQNLATAIDDSETTAPHHPLFGYNVTSVASTTAASTVYVLTQCMGYLNASQCAGCLSQLLPNYTNLCNGSTSGQIYYTDCYFLFDNTSLVFNYSNLNTPPPSPSPSPNPSPVISRAPSQPPAIITSRPNLSEGGHQTATIVGIVLGILGLLVVAALALCVFKRQKKARAQIHKAPQQQGESLLPKPSARRFSLKELQDATDNFSSSKKLGEGGFGPVYQGRLNSGKEVAVKMLSSHSRQGNSEFVNEVNLITSVQHRNLILLLGFCEEDSKQLLVYEYLPNRSLDLCLFDVDENCALDWRTRFNIIVGIARGLRYLHEEAHVRILHRDIKASNILLDSNLDPKIADFGLARLFRDDTSHLTTGVVGTLGYLAPEYAIGGQLSEKVDVYSFGLVVLEIVSGRRAMDTNCEADEQNLLERTWVLYEKHQQLQILDERVQKAGKGLDGNGRSMHVNVGQVVRVVHVALLCTQSQPQARPSMSEVHNMLCSQSEILNTPTRPMTIGMLSPLAELLHDDNSTVFSSSTMPFLPSMKSMYSHDTNSISQVEAR